MDSKKEEPSISEENYPLLRNFIIFFLSAGILISAFVVDYSALPKGFEIPKVFFWQAMAFLAIIFYLIYFLLKTFSSKKVKITKDFIFFLIILGFFLISSLLSPYQDITWLGNDFRFQGFVTYTLIVAVAYIVYKLINKTNWHYISIAFIISGVTQACWGIYQFFTVIKPNPTLYFDGLWVNGFFGQTNWFSGRLLMAIIFAGYYLGLHIKKSYFKETNINFPKFIKHNLQLANILKNIFFGALIIFMAVAIVLSRSIWAMITLPLIVLFILIYELLKRKHFPIVFRVVGVVIVIISIILLSVYKEFNLRIEI